jgi:hypothetical protein
MYEHTGPNAKYCQNRVSFEIKDAKSTILLTMLIKNLIGQFSIAERYSSAVKTLIVEEQQDKNNPS